MRRVRMIMVALLAGSMAALGLGCTGQPTTDWEAQRQAQWVGTGIFGIIYLALCQANGGVCPFPIAPSDPAPGG